MEAILESSLAAARKQESNNPDEKVFHIKDHVFLGTRFGAVDRVAFDAFQIKAVVNLTAGATRVPNRFEALGVQYLHIELMDELVSNPSLAVPESIRALTQWGKDGLCVLVHCQMGLSRSTLVVLAWLMTHAGLSLKSAMELVAERRGRRPKVNPAFWCYLAALEREINGWSPSSEPSFNFVPWLVQDLHEMGFTFPEAEIKKALIEDADWVEFALFYTGLSGSGIKRLMAAQAISQRQGLEAKLARRAADTATELMEVYHCWPALQAFSLRILSQLVAASGKAMCDHILTLGGTGKALSAMRAHPDDASVQEAGCGVLAYLAASCPKAGEEVALLRGPAAIVAALRAHKADTSVQSTGCAALICMEAVHGALAQAAAGRAAEAIVAGMESCHTAEKVQEFGSASLTSLAMRGLVPPASLEAAGAVVQHALKAFPASSMVQQRGSAAQAALMSCSNAIRVGQGDLGKEERLEEPVHRSELCEA